MRVGGRHVLGRPAVVLIGAPGAGKTKLGKRIAKRLKLSFIDTDNRIIAQHGVIANIFETHGEQYFRALERAEVVAALRETAVVSLGGGAVLDQDTQRDLATHRVVLLTVTSEAVLSRISNSRRPLVKGIESWTALVAARTPIYERLADRTFDTSHRPLDTIAAEIASWIQENEQ